MVLRVGLRVVLRFMMGIDVVRVVVIFPWPNLPVSPNHVITATKATVLVG